MLSVKKKEKKKKKKVAHVVSFDDDDNSETKSRRHSSVTSGGSSNATDDRSSDVTPLHHGNSTPPSGRNGPVQTCWVALVLLGGEGFIHKFFVSLFPYFDFFSLQHDVLLKTDEGLKELLEDQQINM